MHPEVFKKDCHSQCENYGVILLTASYKIHSEIIAEGFKPTIDVTALKEETGFRVGRPSSDNIFT
jgi:hypothetical protein